ncbi:AsmA family protein [Thiomicrorhabdus sp. Kp2]|uniref:AsmA family protein n=1 Tax=Thiomicrorhabdus sp. Kp2 TaxID=1123518 RepID=UPI00041FF149|nr:AsmA family protein [Thiomicrorhabdus sp. Kp2]
MTKTTIKWTKRAILILAIIPILLFLAFAGAVSLIDFNQYKPQIEQEVAQLTQRDFKIEGEVKVSILPFMFHMGDMRLKNQPGFETENLMTMKEAQIELSLRALFLEKKLKVISLELIEPHVHFIKQADKNNWSDIKFLAGLFSANQLAEIVSQERQTARLNTAHYDVSVNDLAKKVVSSTHAKSLNLGQVNDSWQLESLAIKNAQIDYSDREQNFSVSLKKANLLTFDIEPNKPFQVNSDFVYEHSQSPRVFDFEINAQMLLAKQFSQLHLANWHGVFRLQLPKEQNRPDIRLTTSGENLMVDFSQQQIYVKKAVLEGLNSQVETSFDGSFGANPVFEGEFDAKEINIKSWVEHLGFPAPEMADQKALSQASGTFHWRWDGKKLSIEQVKVKVDESDITGYLSIPFGSMDSVNATTVFDLTVKDFSLEDYLIKTASNIPTASQVTRPGGLKKGIYPIPISFLQTTSLQGKLTLVDFRALDRQAQRIDLELNSRNGKLELAPFDIAFLQGIVESKLLADLSKPQPEYFWKGRTKSLSLSEVSVKGQQPVTGTLDSHFALKTEGVNPIDWAKNLQGNINANIEQARVYGLDLNQLLQGQVALNAQQPLFTEFNSLQVNGQFTDGVFTPKRFLATAERFKGTGNGELSLVNQQVKGDLHLQIDKPSEALSELKGLVIPLTYQGDMMNPSWSVNLAELNPKIIDSSPVLSALQTLIN